MSYNEKKNPDRTRAGDAVKAGPSGKLNNQTTDSPGTRIGADRVSVEAQPLAETNPKIPQRMKQLRMSYLNCRKSRAALDELTMVRSRDNILLITERPITDGKPPELDKYVLISTEGPSTRVCIYIKENSMIYTTLHEASERTASLRIKTALVRCIYMPPSNSGETNPQVYEPMDGGGEIRMGDFNAAHPNWKDDDPTTSQGTKLSNWANREGVHEIGPRTKTHEKGHKLDLIMTNKPDNIQVMNNGYIEHSDHTCQSVKIPVPYEEKAGETKTDYRKVNLPTLTEIIKEENYPTNKTDATQLIENLENIRQRLPTHTISDRNRLTKEVLDNRRRLNKAKKNKNHKDAYEINTLRRKYRQSMRDHNNNRINETLTESNDNNAFFELSRRGTNKKAIPPMVMDDHTYRTHEEICDALAKHHGADIDEETHMYQPTEPKAPTHHDHHHPIERIQHQEVTEAIKKAPTHSTIGQDDIGLKLLKAYHKGNPGHLEDVFTNILRAGKHPEEWKKAIVVPIPKANKPNYSHPKSWRSLHLLSVVSKTLERIVLKRLQDFGDKNDTLNATQFGSRRNTGTSDAFQIFKEWREQATRENKVASCILIDIDGGFDKVDPDILCGEDDTGVRLDRRYLRWIRHWAKNRKVRFRFNGKTGGKGYTVNRGVPQGSSLSLYLFGSYVRRIVEEKGFSQNVFIISYVDDLLICIKGETEEEVEAIARAVWQAVKERARNMGMDFAENKTKTFHCNSTTSTWRIGHIVREMRFLGYWTTSTNPGEDDGHHKHIKHWLTKANFSYNMIRALTQRNDSDTGLNMMSTIRLLHQTTRTLAWYGLEHYGHETERTKEVDSFLYETMRRLTDMLKATPHRALSVEYNLTPTAIQYTYIKDRISHRHRTFPHIMAKARITANLETTHGSMDMTDTIVPWNQPVPKQTDPLHPLFTKITLETDNGKEHTVPRIKQTLDLNDPEDLIIYTDGSADRGTSGKNPSYGIVVLNSSGNLITTDDGKLVAGKCIHDVETITIYKAVEIALSNKTSILGSRRRKAVIFTDSTTAMDAVLNSKSNGPLAYLNTLRQELEQDEMRPHLDIMIGWIKGHSKIPGNEMADLLVKNCTNVLKDPLPFTTHSKRLMDISKHRQQLWEEWYEDKKHHYQGKPTRRLKKHRGISRRDSSVLLRLKTNKGWNHQDPIGTEPAPRCPIDDETDDGTHKYTCSRWTKDRPGNIQLAINRTIPRSDVVRWIRNNDHFGFRNKMYAVNYIKLKIGQYNLQKDLQCPSCDYMTERTDRLKEHINRKHLNPSTNPKIPIRKKLVCNICHRDNFPAREKYAKHMEAHAKGSTRAPKQPSVENSTRCRYCNKATNGPRNLELHEETHRRCRGCKITHDTIEQLEAHLCSFEYYCGTCDKYFRNTDLKKNHDNQKHPPKEEELTCHGCSKRYRGKEKLKEHQRSNCGGSRS